MKTLLKFLISNVHFLLTIYRRKIEARQQRRLYVKIYCLVFFLVLISIPLFISFLNTEFLAMLFSVFLQNKFIVAFLFFGVILVQFGENQINAIKDI